MPYLAEEIYWIIKGSSLTIYEIVNLFNRSHFPLSVDYDQVYGAIYREWKKGNYVFFKDDIFLDYRIGIDSAYYCPNNRIIGT